jgi:hypothetical protein
MKRQVLLLVALALPFAVTGCSVGKADVTGRVTYRGKTVVTGTVIVRGSDGIEMMGKIGPDGSYSVPGITAGEVKFAVVSRDPAVVNARALVGKGRADGKEEASVPPAPPPLPEVKWFALPDQYESAETSKIGTSLKPGSNQFNIDLP